MSKNTAELRDWIIRHDFNAKTEWHCLTGHIYNDSRGKFIDGQEVVTSRLIRINFENMIAETENTAYKLSGMKSA